MARNYKALIHIAKKELGLDDELYRQILHDLTRKRSIAKMDENELALVLRYLEEKGFKPKYNQAKTENRKGRFHDLAGRRGDMAAPRQLRMLEAIWREAAREPTDAAFRNFLQQRFGIGDVRWIPADKVTPIKAALLRMRNARRRPAAGEVAR